MTARLLELLTKTVDNRDAREMARWQAARAEALLREVAALSAANYRRLVEGE